MNHLDQQILDQRREYEGKELSENSVNPDPMKQFAAWLAEALAAELTEPAAMTLATADADGKPSARIVLLGGFDDNGFRFYTNYRSKKSKELLENPRAALVFFWRDLFRQITIEGTAAKLTAEESDAYFESRPRERQIAAWASEQSARLPSREELLREYEKFSEQFKDIPVPRPEHWGGYRLSPAAIEFWQGRQSRLHDRLLYTLQPDKTWKITRLAP